MSRNSGKILGAIIATSVISLIAVGCGGGGSNNSSSLNTRKAAINTVKATRQMAETFELNNVNVDEEEGLTKRVTRAVVRHAKVARANDIPDHEGEGYDEDEGLYYRVSLTPQGFKVVYHEDEARTRPAGYIELNIPDDSRVYFIFRMDKGREPIWGDLELKYDNAESQAGRLTGWIEDPRTEDRVTFDLRLENNDMASGNITVRTDGKTLQLNNIVRSFERRITANIAFVGLTGSIAQEEDGSGVLTINDRGGVLKAEYDTNGKGKITLPNGQVVLIDDFDSEY